MAEQKALVREIRYLARKMIDLDRQAEHAADVGNILRASHLWHCRLNVQLERSYLLSKLALHRREEAL